MVENSKEVDTSDKLTSKLEVALFLAKVLIFGEFLLFGLAFVMWVSIGTVGSIQIGEDVVYTISVEHAEKAVNILLPITTGNIGALIGYILGKSKIEGGTITE